MQLKPEATRPGVRLIVVLVPGWKTTRYRFFSHLHSGIDNWGAVKAGGSRKGRFSDIFVASRSIKEVVMRMIIEARINDGGGGGGGNTIG